MANVTWTDRECARSASVLNKTIGIPSVLLTSVKNFLYALIRVRKHGLVKVNMISYNYCFSAAEGRLLKLSSSNPSHEIKPSNFCSKCDKTARRAQKCHAFLCHVRVRFHIFMLFEIDIVDWNLKVDTHTTVIARE